MNNNLTIGGNFQKTEFPYLQAPELCGFRDLISELYLHTLSPVGMISSSLIAALSTVFQGVIDVKKPTGQITPVSLLTLNIAERGEGKTTVEKYCFSPIIKFQDDLRKDYLEKLKGWKLSTEVWNRKIKKARGYSGAIGSLELEDESDCLLLELLGSKPEKPIEPQLIYNDSTPIALFEGMSRKTNCAVLLSSEGSNLLNGRAFSDMAKFNSAWDGDEICINRVRGSFSWAGRLTVAIQVQPGPLARFIERRGTEARDMGLLARFLIAKPQTTQGFRFVENRRQLGSAYDNYFSVMMSNLEKFQEYVGNKSSRAVIEFSEEAVFLWKQVFNNVEAQMQVGGLLQDFKDLGNRIMDNVSRLSALLHCYCNGPSGKVSVQVLQDAISIINWYMLEFTDLLYQPSQSQLDAAALERKLGEYLYANRRYVRKSALMQNAPSIELRKKERFNRALDNLINSGRIKIVAYLDYLIVDLFPLYPHDQNALDEVVLQFRNRNK